MLNSDDTPTIRNAITKRLDKERGVKVCDIKFRKAADHIDVQVEMTVDALHVTSEFHLPETWELAHLRNEIDEIAESCKLARMEFWRHGRIMTGRRELPGTGLRGGWARYG